MSYEYCCDDEEDIKEMIKIMENLVVSSKNKLNREIDDWRKQCKELIATVASTDNSRKIKLDQNVKQHESELAELNSNAFNLEQTKEYKRLKELERQESSLNSEIASIADQIQHLEDMSKKVKNHTKLTSQKTLLQFSKLVTGTSFDYQGPNISGIVRGQGLSEFDFDPAKLNEQELSNCLWNVVAKESGKNWSDIVNA